jgi:hypothetical protein
MWRDFDFWLSRVLQETIIFLPIVFEQYISSRISKPSDGWRHKLLQYSYEAIRRWSWSKIVQYINFINAIEVRYINMNM